MSELEQFGEKLVHGVHDMAIVHWEKILEGSMKTAESQELASWLHSQSREVQERVGNLPSAVIRDVVHYLLAWLEEEVAIHVTYQGVDVIEESSGLAGELYGENGWLAKFSDPTSLLE